MMGTLPQPKIDAPASLPIGGYPECFRRIQSRIENLPSAFAAAYSIAGISIRLKFGSSLLQEQISPAICHLEKFHERADTPGHLTVFLHDLISAPAVSELFAQFRQAGNESDIWLFDDCDLTVIVQDQGRTISAIDWNRKAGYFLVRDAAAISYLERAAPLRLLLGHWMGKQGKLLLHAAAVGNKNGGVLLLGHNGAGKSTTALRCIADGLQYAADDHCFVSASVPHTVHSIYNTGKLASDDLDQFPSLLPAARPEGRNPEEKVVFFLNGHPGIRLSRWFPIRAIFLARISNGPQTRLQRATESEGFRALAPSCALHFPTERRRALHAFKSLVRELPAYWLKLGSDPDGISGTIKEFLDRPQR